MRPLRIVHINTHDEEGGAAKLARQLCLDQRRRGHDSRLVVGFRRTRGWPSRGFDLRPDSELDALCQEANLQSLQFQGSLDLDLLPLVAGADVVHLHNIQGEYFNPLALAVLARRKPVVWTLHDMHGFTGFCNHAGDCEGWRAGCHGCGRQHLDRPRPDNRGTGKAELGALGVSLGYALKKAAASAGVLDVVCPSRWLAQKAAAGMLARHPQHVLPNGLDTRRFSPRDKARARARLGLPQDVFLLGGAAVNGVLANPMKGGPEALATLERLRALIPGAMLLNIGTTVRSDHPGVLNLPFQHGETGMAWAYAALDALLHTSRTESFCLVAAEAMACGRPVLAFDCGPLPEVVRHGEDGLLAPGGDTAAMAVNAARLAADPELALRMGASARAGAVERFGLERMAVGYMDIYQSAIAGHARRTAAAKPLDPRDLPPVVRTPTLLGALKRAAGDAGREFPEPQEAAVPLEQRLRADGDVRRRDLLLWALERVRERQRVFALRERGRIQEALTLLETLLRDAPEDLGLLRTYGVTLGLSGRPDLGLLAFERLLQADPLIIDADMSRSDMYRLMGRVDEAWAALDDMARRNPVARGLFARRGMLLRMRGDEQGAQEMFWREQHPQKDAGVADMAARGHARRQAQPGARPSAEGESAAKGTRRSTGN